MRVLQHVYTHCIDGREDLIGQQIEDAHDPDSSTSPYRRSASRNFSNFYSDRTTWGGWGSNPRPADYENYGPALRALYRHGYHGVAPLVALIAPFARTARSIKPVHARPWRSPAASYRTLPPAGA